MIEDLIKISKYAGERFDLAQASGGNSSVKDGGHMLIKSSGYHLSEITADKGFSVVDNEKVLKIFDLDFGNDKQENDKLVSDLVQNALIKGPRPSIETILHALFKKYTLHTHPLSVNVICASKNAQELLDKIFEKDEFLFVSYKTPGIELALELKKQMEHFKKEYKKDADVVFLQNHGLIVCAESIGGIEELTDKVVDKIDTFMEFDFKRYRLTNKISSLVANGDIAYLSEDIYLNEMLKKEAELFHKKPFCPDQMVFCLSDVLKIKSLDDKKAVWEFNIKHKNSPKVVILQDKVFFMGATVKKCRETEEVFKSHLLVLSNIQTHNQNLLSQAELEYLANWEAEKYRQKI